MEDQAYACQHCGVTKPAGQLQQIADMIPAARDVAHGLSRHADGPGGSQKPGSRLPLDLGTTAKLDGVQTVLAGWARHVLEERGSTATHVGDDLILHAAWYLQTQLEWLRHRPEVDEFLGDVAAAARIIAGIARGPVAQRYLGPCGAESTFDLQGLAVTAVCDGDVYAREGASVGRCRTCKAEVSTWERQAWLDGLVRSQAFRAAEIAQAYGVNVNTIRSWATRGQLLEHGRDREERPLYNVGEVLDLAAADAARRASEQAKRARRAAAREADGERMSA
jgi:hypothetical protein